MSLNHIVVCGLSPSRKRLNYEKILDEGGDIYGLAFDELSHRYTHLFEIHPRSLWERRGPEYLKRLQEADVPIFMQEEHEDIPNSVQFPLKEAIERIGRDYFASSISYMISHALLVYPKHLSVWGVDCHTDEEYFKERSANEYLLGLARGLGIATFVPPDSSLFTFNPENMYLDEMQTYGARYGYFAETV